MPIPTPNISEKKGEFLSRCVTFLRGEGTDPDQSVSICMRKWEASKNQDTELVPVGFALASFWIKGTFDGKFTPSKLSAELYNFTYTNVMAGVGKGYGLPTDFKAGSLSYNTALKYRQNVSFFSGAKTFQQQMILSNAVFNEDGTKRSFKEFKEIADNHNILFNENYLKTEQNGAFRIAQSTEAWEEAQATKELFPYLQYLTIGDERVRPEHRAWDGIIKPVDDHFWDTHFPPNNWNCRCIISQIAVGEPTNLKKHLEYYNAKNPPEMRVKSLVNTSKVFANNPGKTGLIFGKDHPYFDIKKPYKTSARDNFGFMIPFDEEVKETMKNI